MGGICKGRHDVVTVIMMLGEVVSYEGRHCLVVTPGQPVPFGVIFCFRQLLYTKEDAGCSEELGYDLRTVFG